MKIVIRDMTMEQYEQVLALWEASTGVGLSEADSSEGVANFLDRNPGLSFVAYHSQQLVGAVLCGHDGRRGYIHHLAVSKAHRRQGVARTLVQQSLAALQGEGIDKCHVFVFRDNQAAIRFWQGTGWTERIDLTMLSHDTQFE